MSKVKTTTQNSKLLIIKDLSNIKGSSNLQPKTYSLNPKKAFTLIELIISMFIFTIFVAVAGSSYVFISRAQRDANETRKVYEEARLLIDQLTEEIRLNTIEWSCYRFDADCAVALNSDPVTILSLVNKAGTNRVRFLKPAGENSLQISRHLKKDETWQGDKEKGFETLNTFLNLNSENIEISRLEFYLSPKADPNENYEKADYQYQPQVTIVMEVTGFSLNRPDNKIKFDLQTTVSSRVY